MASQANSGIYEIVNLVNGKRYIGSAKSIERRFGQHRVRLRGKRHYNRRLQNSWNKYGEASFAFRILVLCPVEFLICFEQAAIDSYRPAYNLAPTAGSTLGVRLSEATKAKIALKAMGRKCPPRSSEYRAKISAAHKGKPKSPAQMAKLQEGRARQTFGEERSSKVSAGLKLAYAEGRHRRDRPPEYREKIAAMLSGRQLTAEHRANMSAAMKGKKRGPYKLSPEKEERRRELGRAAAAALNFKRWGYVAPK